MANTGQRHATSAGACLPVAAALNQPAVLGRFLPRWPNPVLVEQGRDVIRRFHFPTPPPYAEQELGCPAKVYRLPTHLLDVRSQWQTVGSGADDCSVEVRVRDLLTHVLKRIEPCTEAALVPSTGLDCSEGLQLELGQNLRVVEQECATGSVLGLDRLGERVNDQHDLPLEFRAPGVLAQHTVECLQLDQLRIGTETTDDPMLVPVEPDTHDIRLGHRVQKHFGETIKGVGNIPAFSRMTRRSASGYASRTTVR